jgi:hypothetical protein
MTRWILVLVLFLSVTPAFAQTQLGLGASVGTQFFEGDSTRLLGSVDGLLEFGRGGLHIAGDFTDTVTAVHLDATYRDALGDDFSFMFGAGLTHVEFDADAGGGSDRTWNLEVELARRIGRFDAYARLRHYDYRFEQFRNNPLSPSGPAILVGARYRIALAPRRDTRVR